MFIHIHRSGFAGGADNDQGIGTFLGMSVFQLGEAVRAAREQPGEGVIGNAAPAAPSPSGRTSRHRPALGESQKKASHRHPAGNKAKKKH